MHFNTAVAAIMELVNAIYDRSAMMAESAAFNDGGDPVLSFAATTVLRLLMPFAPHMTSELWERLVGGADLESIAWPEYDAAALVRDRIEIAVQVNGKVRSRISIGAESSESEAIEAALADDRIHAELAGRTPRKTVYVRGRLVSVVV